MINDYWDLFMQTGSVEDYLKYKQDVRNKTDYEELDEQSDQNYQWTSLETNQD